MPVPQIRMAQDISADAARNLSVSRPHTAAASCHRDRAAYRNIGTVRRTATPSQPDILTLLGFKIG